MMKKIIICLFACLFLFTGCTDSTTTDSESTVISSDSQSYDETNFFVRTVENQELNQYYISYTNSDGSVTDIYDMGLRAAEPPFLVYDGYIYCAGRDLLKIDYDGNIVERFENGADGIVQINSVINIYDGSIYCIATQEFEIYGDPVALDGVHYQKVRIKVKLDFSEVSVVEELNK